MTLDSSPDSERQKRCADLYAYHYRHITNEPYNIRSSLAWNAAIVAEAHGRGVPKEPTYEPAPDYQDGTEQTNPGPGYVPPRVNCSPDDTPWYVVTGYWLVLAGIVFVAIKSFTG